MADKTIGDLNYAPGTVDDGNTLFVVQQAGTAYKLDGHAFILALTSILDGHGGISSIVYTDPVSPSLDGTLTITLADQSVTTLTVRNGKGIVSIAKTGTAGLVDTYTITYNDGTTGTLTVTNGAKGDTGDAWYVWIRYAGQQPTQDSDIGTTPDNWMGVYSGTSSTAPTHYTDYQWFQIKGAKGDTGNPATVDSTEIVYQGSASGTTVPTGEWSTTIPVVPQGQYLWTRTTVTFNIGNPVIWYSVSYIAVDGTGSPGTATPLVDSGSGVVGAAMSYSRQDHQHPLNVATTGTPQMDGTASRGSEPTYARSDHIHPHDTSKADTGLGITGATVGKVPVISAVDGNGVPTAFAPGDGGDVTADMLGIVIDGNSTPVGASVGQYVIVKDSTISGITDGLYTAELAIPASTAIDSTYLTKVSDGGLNDLLGLYSSLANSVKVVPFTITKNDAYINAISAITSAKIGRLAVVSLTFSVGTAVPNLGVLFNGLPRPLNDWGGLVGQSGTTNMRVKVTGTTLIADGPGPTGWYSGTLAYITYS